MNKPSLLAGMMVAVALMAPAALAQSSSTTTQTQTNQRTMSGHPMSMTNMGVSVPFMLQHAYIEAIHAQSSAALGMNEMAANHLENARMILDDLSNSREIANNTNLRNRLTAIRDNAQNLSGNSNPTQMATFVGRFVTLFNDMPTMMASMGGGGGLAPTALHAPADMVAMAQESAANAQADAATNDWAGAKLNIQRTIATLDMAAKTGQGKNMTKEQRDRISFLRREAGQVQTAINNRNTKNAVQGAGQLVLYIGSAVPLMAGKGGGGGQTMPQEQMQHEGGSTR